MGEITLLIRKIRIDKNAFQELVDRMEPLIKKNIRLLYKDEKEDVRSEMILALWEAVTKIKYYENDGECMTFLCNALKNRFYELYRKSKKEHDNQIFLENDDAVEMNRNDIAGLDDVLFHIDIEMFLKEYDGKKQKIFRKILTEDESDAEIAQTLFVTRQYVNRMRRELYRELADRHFV